MPQMMPINWLLSFIFFICIFILFNMIIFYIYPSKKMKMKINNICNNNKNILFWKW